MASLYELTGMYRNLEDLMDNEELPQDQIQKALDELDGDIEDKVENLIKVHKNLSAEAEMFKIEERNMKNKRTSRENQAKRVKEYIEEQMKFLNKEEVKTKLFTAKFQKNPPSARVEDEKLLDSKYYITEKKVLTQLILDDLKAGIEVKGAKLHQGTGLRIR